ncbi:hypothetical protein ILUMI_23750 [Ignelater luminosus]|uniref:MutL C-terminal dimerisation domain-containing protein n=1 Tax=Ignelater luminosus TaxID=2038154 RepID=A0A8K0CBV5_IGNLU|nr:hypothetical protein ILUMI_23750 [Ignelater luminosus]
MENNLQSIQTCPLNCHIHIHCNHQDTANYRSPYFRKRKHIPTTEVNPGNCIGVHPQRSKKPQQDEINFQFNPKQNPEALSKPIYPTSDGSEGLKEERQFFKPSLQKNILKSKHKLKETFFLPSSAHFSLIPSAKNEFQNPFAQTTFLQKKPFAVLKEKNSLLGKRKRKQLKQQDRLYNDQNRLENISKPCKKTFKKARKFSTKLLYQNSSTDNFFISNLKKSPDEKLKINFRKFHSEPFQFFNNLNSSANVSNSNEFNFLTPNINKSTTISNDTIEEIKSTDSTEDPVNSTVCFDNFKPKLSSTQYFNKTNLDVSKNSTQNSKFNSNVVDETPNKDLENFFVPSLALPSQKSVKTTNKNLFELNQSKKEEENNKGSSVLEISFSATKKFKPFDCKSNKRSASNDSQQKETNFIFPEILAEENLKHDGVTNEWIKRTDNFGNEFYIHKRTGMTSMQSPKQISNFDFVKRIEFIPKGLSPVLVEAKKVDKSLSPTSKKSLYATIMENYENELNIIKWSHYINDYKDANKFFEELYREQAKQFQSLIPNINVNDLPKSMKRLYSKSHGQSFTKDIFADLTIVGQLDKKFIVALSKGKNLIILFDQHAVHERVRLETLFSGYTETESGSENLKFKSSKCPQKIALNLMEIDINILINSRRLFENLGLSCVISENSLEVTHIPTCMYNKFIKNDQCDNNNLENILTSLIYEQISTILSTRGTVTKIPNILQNIINLEACRGAIKFGDRLTSKKCEELIKELSKCKLPFQCAHGRPTLVPLIDFSNISSKQVRKADLKKLLI